MQTIWKFTLSPRVKLEMPVGARILSVQAQGDDICLWALVDPTARKEVRKFVSYCTGDSIPSLARQFIGTVQMKDGIVFHVFEELTTRSLGG